MRIYPDVVDIGVDTTLYRPKLLPTVITDDGIEATLIDDIGIRRIYI